MNTISLIFALSFTCILLAFNGLNAKEGDAEPSFYLTEDEDQAPAEPSGPAKPALAPVPNPAPNEAIDIRQEGWFPHAKLKTHQDQVDAMAKTFPGQERFFLERALAYVHSQGESPAGGVDLLRFLPRQINRRAFIDQLQPGKNNPPTRTEAVWTSGKPPFREGILDYRDLHRWAKELLQHPETGNMQLTLVWFSDMAMGPRLFKSGFGHQEQLVTFHPWLLFLIASQKYGPVLRVRQGSPEVAPESYGSPLLLRSVGPCLIEPNDILTVGTDGNPGIVRSYHMATGMDYEEAPWQILVLAAGHLSRNTLDFTEAPPPAPPEGKDVGLTPAEGLRKRACLEDLFQTVYIAFRGTVLADQTAGKETLILTGSPGATREGPGILESLAIQYLAARLAGVKQIHFLLAKNEASERDFQTMRSNMDGLVATGITISRLIEDLTESPLLEKDHEEYMQKPEKPRQSGK